MVPDARLIPHFPLCRLAPILGVSKISDQTLKCIVEKIEGKRNERIR